MLNTIPMLAQAADATDVAAAASPQADVLMVLGGCCLVFGIVAGLLMLFAPHLGRREGRLGWIGLSFAAMLGQVVLVGVLLLIRQVFGGSWDLHFNGSLHLDLILVKAFLQPGHIMMMAEGITVLACWLYWRELVNRQGAAVWAMPVMRGMAIALACIVFTEPVLTITHTDNTIARLLVFVDGSASMAATDDQMDTSRKLRSAVRLGWLKNSPFDDHVRRARLHLSKARKRLDALEHLNGEAWDQGLADLRSAIDHASTHMNQVETQHLPQVVRDTFEADILTPVKNLSAANPSLAELAPAIDRWIDELDRAMSQEDREAAANLDAEQQAAIERHDQAPRWQRLEESLLGGDESIFEKLTLMHKVDLYTITSNSYKMTWHPGMVNDQGEVEMPRELGLAGTISNVLTTDLVTGVRQGAVSDDSVAGRLFVVMATDGQHNARASLEPEVMAGDFGAQNIQLHLIGMGTVHQPRDLAVVKVDGVPSKVQWDEEDGVTEKLAGRVLFKDGMPAGKEFTVSITHKGEELWNDTYITDGGGSRETDLFEIDRDRINAIIEAAQKDQRTDLRHINLPLELGVNISPLEGEVDVENNNATLRVNVVTQKNRVLILDGRPRWEFRYLKNLFERDKRWEVHTLLPQFDFNGNPLGFGARGNRPDEFPSSYERLRSYQLIIFGDLSPSYFTPQERKWLREFVQYNAGGMIFIDGHINRLSSHTGDNEGLGPLFPVRLRGNEELRTMDLKYRPLTDDAAIQLDTDPLQNANIWGTFQGPRRITRAEKLRGAETLLEAFGGGENLPAMVRWRYGAGKVLYIAADESWRWRLDVGDKFHEKFWKATAKATMEEPFAVMDQYVALDTGDPSYGLGERALIRVRVLAPAVVTRLEQAGLKPAAVIFRDGKQVGRIPLDPDLNSSLYRGMTDPLQGGDYEVRVEVPGIDPSLIKVRTQFIVERQLTNERAVLHCNQRMLQGMARQSGGEYYPEEHLDLLLESLEEFSAARSHTEEYFLWRTYWTFLPIILLITLEWVIRKRTGLL